MPQCDDCFHSLWIRRITGGWVNNRCNHEKGHKKFPLNEIERCGFYIRGESGEIV